MDLILSMVILAVVDLFMPTTIVCTAYLVTRQQPYRNSLAFILSNYLTWFAFGLIFFVLFGVLWWGTLLAWYARDYLELAVGICLIAIAAFSHAPQFSLSRFDKHLSVGKLGLAGVLVSLMQLPSCLTFVAAIALMHQHGVGFVTGIPLLLGYCVSFVLVSLGIVGARFVSGEHYETIVQKTYTYVIDPFKHIFRIVVAIVGIAFILHWSIFYLIFGLHARPDWHMPERPQKGAHIAPAPIAR